MEEVWKDIIGFEGYYQISNFGRVNSIERYVKHKTRNGVNDMDQYVPRKIRTLATKGRQDVTLFKDGISKKIYISRTVLTYFKEPPSIEKPHCMHLDHNPLNNRVDNLKWGSHSDNMQMDWRDGRRTAYSHWTGIINENNPHSKPLVQLDLNGNLIKNWPNSKEVERQTKIPSRGVRKCCNGEIKSHKGYIFKYESDFNSKVIQQKLF